MIKRTLAERLAHYSERQGKCLVWTGTKDRDGYGLLTTMNPKRSSRAHRVAFEFLRGPIPSGLFVCHTCDNPSCIEITHLFLGTAKENTQDMLAKGRRKKSRRDAGHHNTKISHAERGIIRERRALGETTTAIAISYGVTQSLISQICVRHGGYSEQAERLANGA